MYRVMNLPSKMDNFYLDRYYNLVYKEGNIQPFYQILLLIHFGNQANLFSNKLTFSLWRTDYHDSVNLFLLCFRYQITI